MSADQTADHVAVCGKCGDRAVQRPPQDWRAVLTPRPDWSHTDGTPLCPIPPTVPRWPADTGTYATRPHWTTDPAGYAQHIRAHLASDEAMR